MVSGETGRSGRLAAVTSRTAATSTTEPPTECGLGAGNAMTLTPGTEDQSAGQTQQGIKVE